MKETLFIMGIWLLPSIAFAQKITTAKKPPVKPDFSIDAKPASKDQGIWNAFHRAHLGQIIFSENKIIHNAPDPALSKTQFDLTTPLKGRLYLEKSLGNIYAEEDAKGTHPAGTWNHGLFGKLYVQIDVNNEKREAYFMTIGDRNQVSTWTTWYYDLIEEKERPWNVVSDNEPGYWLNKIIEKLAPGEHTIGITLYLVQKDVTTIGRPIASGKFKLAFSQKQKAEWEKKHGYQHLFNGPSSGDYTVTIRNSCNKDIAYSIVRPGSTVYENIMQPDVQANARLNAGDRIVLADGANIFTATHGCSGTMVNLCK